MANHVSCFTVTQALLPDDEDVAMDLVVKMMVEIQVLPHLVVTQTDDKLSSLWL